MRLKSLYIRDFRSIQGEMSISLDSSIVLIHGPNGAGKTSLLSAIELALTGAIPSLSRAEPEYLAYLIHKDRPYGEVRLEIVDDGGQARTGSIRVTPQGIEGVALLEQADATWFSDRSYLAQSTLGRLLEIYQYAEKKEQSPLTRFVKELLGLDRMEALIDGLHTAGNVSRLKSAVPEYAQTREMITAAKKEREALRIERVAADASERSVAAEVQDALVRVEPDLGGPIEDLEGLALRLEDNPNEEAQREIIRLRQEIDVADIGWRQWSQASGTTWNADVAGRADQTRNAFAQWMSTDGQTVEYAIARAAEMVREVVVLGEEGFVHRSEALKKRLAGEIDSLGFLIDEQIRAGEERERKRAQLTSVTARLERIDEQIKDNAGANEALANALAALTAHIDSDVCPVCDRDFAETGRGHLASHVSAKVSAMVEQAGLLQALVRDRVSTSATVVRLDREIAAATVEILSEEDLTRHRTRQIDLSRAIAGLENLDAVMMQGDALRADAATAARDVLARQTADQSGVVMRESLQDLARRVGALSDDAVLDGAELITRLRTALDARDAGFTRIQALRSEAADSLTALMRATKQREALDDRFASAEERLAALEARKMEADAIIASAKELARQTREARSEIVRRVFNDELNHVWRDLFVRLAPEEPYIPAFALPESATAGVEAVLETRHRRGGKGGNPRAMLSAGNLNTAALTLFLAIHLTSNARLPWLVIDDPVQSMDEVHIAQFAALLRTLSKQMEKQVVIAVHERSLFDYLSLELSPTYDGDRLNLITPGRNAVGETTGKWEPRLYAIDRAFAA